MRFHVHTDRPDKLFEILSSKAHVFNQKVDDMVFQDDVAHNRKFPIAIVTDSSADLPVSFREDKQVHMVPINLHFGRTHFLDRITITPSQFYDKLDSAKDYPTTSQPSKKEFFNKFNYLSTHYDSIIALNLSRALSGTYQNSHLTSLEVMERTGKKITVIDSKTISAGMGLIIMRAVEALEQGHTHEEVVNLIQSWVPKSQIFVNVKTLKYFVKGGRISPMKGFIANTLNLKPIITIDKEGKAITHDKKFSRRATINYVLNYIRKALKTKQIWNYAVVFSNKEEEESAHKYADKLKEVIGKEASFIESISPVVGVNAGLGTLAVAILYE